MNRISQESLWDGWGYENGIAEYEIITVVWRSNMITATRTFALFVVIGHFVFSIWSATARTGKTRNQMMHSDSRTKISRHNVRMYFKTIKKNKNRAYSHFTWDAKVYGHKQTQFIWVFSNLPQCCYFLYLLIQCFDHFAPSKYNFFNK